MAGTASGEHALGETYEKRARKKRKERKKREKSEQKRLRREQDPSERESDEDIAARYLDLPEDDEEA